MNQDHLGNELYVRAVNRFNRVSLPAQIADYLRAKKDMILDADKPSDRDDLCIFRAPKDRGFLVNHFSSHVGLALKVGWGVNRKMFGIRPKNHVPSTLYCRIAMMLSLKTMLYSFLTFY
ncbi:MAG: hypothetical protein JKY11_03145 [Alphaproteobacteria bacterium]|nr:hypothetical protein [Alphaproteobacteria bacterium]